MPNKDARFEDYPEKNKMRDFDERHSHYLDSETYRVEQAPTLMPAFQLIREDLADLDFKPHTKILKEGDRVIFKWK